MSDIKHFLRIRKTPDVVFKAITEESGLKGWWTEETKANSREKILEFSFTGTYPNTMKIIKSESNKIIEWECIKGFENSWIGNHIFFELTPEGDNTTILKFKHSGLKEDEERLANINYNWGRFLFSLKTYCETGKGFPVKRKK